MELQLDSDGVRLKAFLANPPAAASPSRGLVLCHGRPPEASSPVSDASFNELATSLAAASGWTVLTFEFRVTAKGGGALTMRDWLGDLRIAFEHLAARDGIAGVWLAGFSVGGALALCLAGADEHVRGVASFGAPAEFDDWSTTPGALWPLQSISKVPPRPVLLVHGDADELVPVADARALADAAGGEVELRILAGGGHALRYDPRATAVLEGWLDRQPG
ncbi:MAG TPA: alpha/beta family hydrolase [Acidimicrobiales bacterium]|nr:alpha/beta family hydrolase [Acidimicrobiales bacterium]